MLKSSFRRIVTGIVFFSLTVVAAVVGYMVAGWNFLDAIYMVVITIFGVGYGEVKPLSSPTLKVFTIFVIIAGALSVAYTVSGFVQMITEGEIHRALNLKRMSKEIEQLEDHVIICGFGRIGQLVAHRLKDSREAFIILDSDAERVALAQAQGYLIHQGDATDETALEAVGIHRAKSLATVLPNDAANVFITLTAREMNPSLMILARGEMPTTEKKLRLAGADHVVLPASISALRMAHLISHPSAVDFLSQTDGHQGLNEFLAELDIQLNELVIGANSPLIGGTIGDIELKGQGSFITVALRRGDGEVVIHPSRATYLAQGDSIILMGHQGDMPSFAQQSALKREMRYRGARVR
ncbi:potassium channel family protein [Leptolyngbya sp. KIOST-1]|uniref:potassium channel family protein n=1 Tax=Leptolyngbya sp. KIOST-1 TaxID=1229172 RepID=UPI000B1936EE|nr:potassium channel protein [Leptolyngbya sp. KIOST-1]